MEGMADSESATANTAGLQNPSAEELRELLETVTLRVPGVSDWLDVQRASRSEDPAELLAIVNQVMTPLRRFYDYGQANEYADDCHDTVELLAHRAIHATPNLIPVIERAITLVTRAILKSDDSSGARGDLVHALLQAHATSVCSSTPPLTQSGFYNSRQRHSALGYKRPNDVHYGYIQPAMAA